MLTPRAQLNLTKAREYFREHLCVGDYYAETQRVAGEWHGAAALMLDLRGHVAEAEFLALCEGKHPKTHERLTQRLNGTRESQGGQRVSNRRVFYDFVFSPPKSVSAVALIQDERIVGLHRKTVVQALGELEKITSARVRRKGV